MKTPLKIIGILVGVGFTVIAGAAAAQPATFMIVNFGSGLCLEPNGSGLGAPILQQPCDSTRMTQRWVASRATATQCQIANKGFPTCLDVRNGVNADRVRSGLLTDAMIADRAKARGVSEAEYMSGNLLGREVTAKDVAQAFLHHAVALKTTADVTTVDGGNIAAALR